MWNDSQRRALPQFGNLMLVRPVMLLIKVTKFSYDYKSQLILGQADD